MNAYPTACFILSSGLIGVGTVLRASLNTGIAEVFGEIINKLTAGSPDAYQKVETNIMIRRIILWMK